MNILNQANVKTMSSREMSQLCDKSHDNVLKTIRLLIDKGVVSNTTPHQYTHEQNGQRYTEFLSDKRDSLVIVARLSPEFTAAVVDRWQDLEAQANQPAIALPDFTNPVTAARAWADELEAKQIAQEQLAIAAPKVAHYDAVVERSTLLNATQVAHSIGLPSAQALNKKLEALGVYNGSCKRGKEFRAWFLEKGLGEMKQVSTGHQQPLFTTKGQVWIFDKLASQSVA